MQASMSPVVLNAVQLPHLIVLASASLTPHRLDFALQKASFERAGLAGPYAICGSLTAWSRLRLFTSAFVVAIGHVNGAPVRCIGAMSIPIASGI